MTFNCYSLGYLYNQSFHENGPLILELCFPAFHSFPQFTFIFFFLLSCFYHWLWYDSILFLSIGVRSFSSQCTDDIFFLVYAKICDLHIYNNGISNFGFLFIHSNRPCYYIMAYNIITYYYIFVPVAVSCKASPLKTFRLISSHLRLCA